MSYVGLLIIEARNAKVKDREHLVFALAKYSNVVVLNELEPHKLCLYVDENGYFDFDADDWVMKWDIRSILSFIHLIIGEGEVDVILKDTYLGDFGYRVTPECVYRLEMQWAPTCRVEIFEDTI